MKREVVSFHSFRHGFNDALAQASVVEERRDRILGWKGGKRMARHYGKGLMADDLYEDVKKAAYPGLDLSHLYTTDR